MAITEIEMEKKSSKRAAREQQESSWLERRRGNAMQSRWGKGVRGVPTLLCHGRCEAQGSQLAWNWRQLRYSALVHNVVHLRYCPWIVLDSTCPVYDFT